MAAPWGHASSAIIAAPTGRAVEGRAGAIRSEPDVTWVRSVPMLVTLTALGLVLVSPAWAQRGRGGGGGGSHRSPADDGRGQRLPTETMPRVDGYPLQLSEVLASSGAAKGVRPSLPTSARRVRRGKPAI